MVLAQVEWVVKNSTGGDIVSAARLVPPARVETMQTNEEHAQATVALGEKINATIPAGTPNGIVLAALATVIGASLRIAPFHEKEVALRHYIKLIKDIARLPPPETEH